MAGKRVTDLPAADVFVGSELMAVSQLSSTVRITASTISAAGADNSYNDSGNGFVSAGFIVGDRVNVSGFTGDAANNIVVGVVTAVDAGKLTIGGTDGDAIVDDAAGEPVTIAKWTSRRANASRGGYAASVYWRLKVRSNRGSNAGLRIGEIKFYDANLSEISRTGLTVTQLQGSANSGSSVNNMIDNKPTTFFRAGEDPDSTNQIFMFQFPSPVAVAAVGISVTGDSLPGAPSDFEIWYSSDADIMRFAWRSSKNNEYVANVEYLFKAPFVT